MKKALLLFSLIVCFSLLPWPVVAVLIEGTEAVSFPLGIGIIKSDYITGLYDWNITRRSEHEWKVCVTPNEVLNASLSKVLGKSFNESVVNSLITTHFKQETINKTVFSNDLKKLAVMPIKRASGAEIRINSFPRSTLDFSKSKIEEPYCFSLIDTNDTTGFEVEIGFNTTLIAQYEDDEGYIIYRNGTFFIAYDDQTVEVWSWWDGNYTWTRGFIPFPIASYCGKSFESANLIAGIEKTSTNVNNNTINVSWTGAPYGSVTEPDWSAYNGTINASFYPDANTTDPGDKKNYTTTIIPWLNYATSACYDYFGIKFQCATEDQLGFDFDCYYQMSSGTKTANEFSYLELVQLNQTNWIGLFNHSLSEWNASCSVTGECIGVILADVNGSHFNTTIDSNAASFNDNRLKCDTADVCWENLTYSISNGEYELWMSASDNFWVSTDNSTWVQGFSSNPKKVISSLTVTNNNLNIYLWSNDTAAIGYADRFTLVPVNLFNSGTNLTFSWEDINKDIINITFTIEAPGGTNYTYQTNFSLLDDFENVTDWVSTGGNNDALKPVAETTRVKEDTQSMNASTDISLAGGNSATIQKFDATAGTAKDVSNITGVGEGNPTQGFQSVWEYVADLDNLSPTAGHQQLSFGNDSGNRMLNTYGKENFTVAGWNLLTFDLTARNAAGRPDYTNMTLHYIVVRNSGTADFDSFFDNWVLFDSPDLYWNGYNSFQANPAINETGAYTIYADIWHDTLTGPITNGTSHSFDVTNQTNYTLFYDIQPPETSNLTQGIIFDYNAATVTNITDVVFEWNGTNYTPTDYATSAGQDVYNSTNITLQLQSANNTATNFRWYFTINYTSATDKITRTAQATQNAIYVYSIDDVSYNDSFILEGDTIIMLLNTTNITDNGTITAQFEWNGTNYTNASFNPATNTINWTSAIISIPTIPSPNNSQVITGLGWINLTFEGTEKWRSLGNATTVYRNVIDNCTVGSQKAYEIWHSDEVSKINITLDADITLNITLPNGANTSHSFQTRNNITLDICVFPDFLNVTITNMEIQYWNDTHSTRNYFLTNVNADNTTNYLQLWSLNQSDTGYDGITFTVQNNTGSYEAGLTLKFNRYRFDEGAFSTVAMARTDSTGKAFTYLQLYDAWYAIIAEDSTGNVLNSFERRILTSDGITLVITYEDLVKFWEYNKVRASCTFNATGSDVLRATVTDPTGLMGTAHMQVWRMQPLGQTRICDSTGSGASVIVLCDNITNDAFYEFRVWANFSGTNFTIDCPEFDDFLDLSITTDRFSRDGIIITLLFGLTMMFSAVGNIPISLFMLVLSIGAAFLMQVNVFSKEIFFIILSLTILIIFRILRHKRHG